MNSPLIHERRRIMAPAKKVDFCQLIRECHSLVAAAKWIDVSIRTVQHRKTHNATPCDTTASEATTAPPSLSLPATDPSPLQAVTYEFCRQKRLGDRKPRDRIQPTTKSPSPGAKSDKERNSLARPTHHDANPAPHARQLSSVRQTDYDFCRQNSLRRQSATGDRVDARAYASSGAACSSATASTAAVIGGTKPARW